jgi:hypothetical protein
LKSEIDQKEAGVDLLDRVVQLPIPCCAHTSGPPVVRLGRIAEPPAIGNRLPVGMLLGRSARASGFEPADTLFDANETDERASFSDGFP